MDETQQFEALGFERMMKEVVIPEESIKGNEIMKAKKSDKKKEKEKCIIE